jgi:archaeosortase A (PGF-CTERM-specific)
MDIILAAGLIGLLIGYYLKDKRRHKFRIIGLSFFGIFWLLQAPHFLAMRDAFNAMVCILALPFYLYLAYNEFLSLKWNEDNESLKWITGASFFAGGLYFVIDKIPILSGGIIYAVAVQTVFLVNLMGFGYGVGEINYAGNPLLYRTNFNEIFVPLEGSSVAIIQSCTAVQSMLIFVGAIYCVTAPKNRKWKGFFFTVPVIYVLNLIRNFGIIYMMDELNWSYETAHNTVGKMGSFLALIALAFIAFKVLPELLDNVWGIVDLTKRKQKGDEEEVKEDGEVEEEDLEEQGVEDKEEGIEEIEDVEKRVEDEEKELVEDQDDEQKVEPKEEQKVDDEVGAPENEPVEKSNEKDYPPDTT